VVPWYEYHEFRELSSRTFRTLEEQLYLKKAQMKRQNTQHVAILIPGTQVQLVKAPTVKDYTVKERHREEGKQTTFHFAGCFATPEQATRELEGLEQKLLEEANPAIDVQATPIASSEFRPTPAQKASKPRTRAKKPKPNIYDTIPPLVPNDPDKGAA